MYVTYEIKRRTRGGGYVTLVKVKRVRIAGDVRQVQIGRFRRRDGRAVLGAGIVCALERSSGLGNAGQTVTRIVEVPDLAQRVCLYRDAEALPHVYRRALLRDAGVRRVDRNRQAIA